MLCGARDASVERVDIEVMPGDHVARRQRALVEMNMLTGVDDAARVIKINQQGLAILLCFRLHDMHRSACRAEIDLVARWLHVVLGVAAMQHEITCTIG